MFGGAEAVKEDFARMEKRMATRTPTGDLPHCPVCGQTVYAEGHRCAFMGTVLMVPPQRSIARMAAFHCYDHRGVYGTYVVLPTILQATGG